MPLLKNNAFITDSWVHLGTEDPLPEGGNVSIPFSRLKNEWDSLAKFPGQLGALLSNTDHVEDVAHFLPRLALIILPFPMFVDGRAYSIARQIRLLGYRGELRATGKVLPDQFQFMTQVGFSSFEVSERYPLEVWQQASKQMSLAYQRGLYRRVGEAEVWSERHEEAAPEPTPWEEQPHAG
jgi:uncharacterized protein (DUF934 family)